MKIQCLAEYMKGWRNKGKSINNGWAEYKSW